MIPLVDDFDHIVRRGDIFRSLTTGCEVTALCGATFVAAEPGSDAGQASICPMCEAVATVHGLTVNAGREVTV